MKRDPVDIDTDRYYDGLERARRLSIERDRDVTERAQELRDEWAGSWGDFFAALPELGIEYGEAETLMEYMSFVFDASECTEPEAATRFYLMRNAAERLSRAIARAEIEEDE